MRKVTCDPSGKYSRTEQTDERRKAWTKTGGGRAIRALDSNATRHTENAGEHLLSRQSFQRHGKPRTTRVEGDRGGVRLHLLTVRLHLLTGRITGTVETAKL